MYKMILNLISAPDLRQETMLVVLVVMVVMVVMV